MEPSHEAEAANQELRAAFLSGRTRPVSWRRRQLRALCRLLRDHESELHSCLSADLSKSAFESDFTELHPLHNACSFMLRHIRRLSKPSSACLPWYLSISASSASLCPEPLGVALIFSTWNYPILLSLEPLIAAIAAGNAALVKPSELSPASSDLLSRLLPAYLDPSAVKILQGGPSLCADLLSQPWDKIFYTGSPAIARSVMASASAYLTPLTLELGGKCPVLVHGSCDLRLAARRIAYPKWSFAAGQTCIAPDYVVVEKSVCARFVEALKQAMAEFGFSGGLSAPGEEEEEEEEEQEQEAECAEKALIIDPSPSPWNQQKHERPEESGNHSMEQGIKGQNDQRIKDQNDQRIKGQKNHHGIKGQKNHQGIKGQKNHHGIKGQKNHHGIKGQKNHHGIKGQRRSSGDGTGSARIVSASHFLRLKNMIEDAVKGGAIEVKWWDREREKSSESEPQPEPETETESGSESSPESSDPGIVTGQNQLRMRPTILLNPAPGSLVMTEEIFGPILPIVEVDDILGQGVGIVNSKPKPLAIYVFSADKTVAGAVAARTSSGSLVINDVGIQFTLDSVPFGGVGQSGMGSYHGEYGFHTFSHLKPVVRIRGDFAPFRYPPYTARRKALLSSLCRHKNLKFFLIYLGIIKG